MAKVETGDRFGRAIVRRCVLKVSTTRKCRWECVCDCGTIFVTSAGNLISGDTNSCGCLRRELTSKRRKLPPGEFQRRRNEDRKRRRSWETSRARERRHAAKTRLKYPIRTKAYRAVRSALLSGVLKRPELCERCLSPGPKAQDGRSGIHAHHYKGYDYPLDVEWICVYCHSKEHAKIKPTRGDT